MILSVGCVKDQTPVSLDEVEEPVVEEPEVPEEVVLEEEPEEEVVLEEEPEVNETVEPEVNETEEPEVNETEEEPFVAPVEEKFEGTELLIGVGGDYFVPGFIKVSEGMFRLRFKEVGGANHKLMFKSGNLPEQRPIELKKGKRLEKDIHLKPGVYTIYDATPNARVRGLTMDIEVAIKGKDPYRDTDKDSLTIKGAKAHNYERVKIDFEYVRRAFDGLELKETIEKNDAENMLGIGTEELWYHERTRKYFVRQVMYDALLDSYRS